MDTHRTSWHNGEHWYAVHTKPRMEYMVQDLLLHRGIGAYLPLLAVAHRRSARSRPDKPFFASYLFARLDLGKVPLSSVNWSPGVTRVVSFGGQPAVLADEVILWLQDRLARIDGREYLQGLPLRPGDRLRVNAGPLKSLEAIFEKRLSSQGRAQVFVEIMGRLTACQIDLNCLERTAS